MGERPALQWTFRRGAAFGLGTLGSLSGSFAAGYPLFSRSSITTGSLIMGYATLVLACAGYGISIWAIASAKLAARGLLALGSLWVVGTVVALVMRETSAGASAQLGFNVAYLTATAAVLVMAGGVCLLMEIRGSQMIGGEPRGH